MQVPMQLYEILALAGIVTLWVLLPLIPAVLIYWLFPGNAVAISGPLAGLTVKASGAFAGYLIVFVLITSWVSQAYYTVGGWLHPAWTITGNMRIFDKKGAVSHPGDSFFQKISVRTQPEMNSFHDPTFTITIPEGPRGVPIIFLDTEFGVVPAKLENINWYEKSAEIKEVEIHEPTINDSDDRRPQTVTSH